MPVARRDLLHVLDTTLANQKCGQELRQLTQALAKWQFEPAARGGAPVEVDAVFEIPFRLAPKPPR